MNKMQYEYTKLKEPGGISKNNRRLLDLLNRQQKGPFKTSDAAKTMGIEKKKASRLLAHWASRGWLSRIRKGLYITVPLGAVNPADRREDPWIVATRIFEPCYIGGWSACEHWGLTEQIFKDIIIITSRKIRERKLNIQNTLYIIKVVNKEKLFGTNIVWREQTKAIVSDPSRTLIDILDDPYIGGGMRHISEVVKNFFMGELRDERRLIEYIEKLNNRTVYKRLGYIIETLNLNLQNLIKTCHTNLSKGYSTFDPTVDAKGTFIRKWNLRVNTKIK